VRSIEEDQEDILRCLATPNEIDKNFTHEDCDGNQENSFTIEIEDDNHFSSENSRKTETKNWKLPTATADIKTRNSSQSSLTKNGKTLNKETSANFYDNDFELLLWKQESSESWMNNLNSSGDFSKFINFIESIRRRLDRKNSKQVYLESNKCSSTCSNRTPASSKSSSPELADIFMENYMEIMELNEQISHNTFKIL